jgi:hypothetical protein
LPLCDAELRIGHERCTALEVILEPWSFVVSLGGRQAAFNLRDGSFRQSRMRRPRAGAAGRRQAVHRESGAGGDVAAFVLVNTAWRRLGRGVQQALARIGAATVARGHEWSPNSLTERRS